MRPRSSHRHAARTRRFCRVLHGFAAGALAACAMTMPATGVWAAGESSESSAERMTAASPRSASFASASPAAARWYPPLGPPLQLEEPYRQPPTPYAAGHRGIDLPVSTGSTVYAPAGGVVSFVGKVVDREVVSIRVDARTVLSMEPVDAEGLSEGDAVARGAVVGSATEGGHCGSACLHLGVRVDGEYVNPMRFFLGRPILLPW